MARSCSARKPTAKLGCDMMWLETLDASGWPICGKTAIEEATGQRHRKNTPSCSSPRCASQAQKADSMPGRLQSRLMLRSRSRCGLCSSSSHERQTSGIVRCLHSNKGGTRRRRRQACQVALGVVVHLCQQQHPQSAAGCAIRLHNPTASSRQLHSPLRQPAQVLKHKRHDGWTVEHMRSSLRKLSTSALRTHRCPSHVFRCSRAELCKVVPPRWCRRMHGSPDGGAAAARCAARCAAALRRRMIKHGAICGCTIEQVFLLQLVRVILAPYSHGIDQLQRHAAALGLAVWALPAVLAPTQRQAV